MDDLDALYRVTRLLDEPDQTMPLEHARGAIERLRLAKGEDPSWLGSRRAGALSCCFRSGTTQDTALRIVTGWLGRDPIAERIGKRRASKASEIHHELAVRAAQRKHEQAVSTVDYERLWTNENLPRVQRLRSTSPLEVTLVLSSAASGLVWFLLALERYFNMPERIRAERTDLLARQAEREADSEEARLRAAEARRKLEDLQPEPRPYRLMNGELRFDDDEVAYRNRRPS